MKIEFPPMQWLPFDRDVVTYPAIIDGKKTTFTITEDEIERMTGRVVMPGKLEEEFVRLRPEIESRTREQIVSKPR